MTDPTTTTTTELALARALLALQTEVDKLRAACGEAHLHGIAEGERRERAAVVAWMCGEADSLYRQARGAGGSGDTQGPLLLWSITDRMEHGEHRREVKP